MTAQPVTIHLPDALYRQLRVRAEQHQQSVADEVLELLATTVPIADELPTDLAQALTPLALLDDPSLWQAARTRLSAAASARLETLHHKRQREGLTAQEEQKRATLVRHYERAMLVRAQATALLKARGHDVTSLLVPA